MSRISYAVPNGNGSAERHFRSRSRTHDTPGSLLPQPRFVSEVSVNWNRWIRQIHRWLSIIFTVSVIVTFIALGLDEPIVWVSYVPLAPLFLLLLTGLYLFVLPYAARRRGRHSD